MTDEAVSKAESAPPPWRRLDRKVSELIPGNVENLLAVILLAVAVVTRLYGLGDRVASHDEVNHYVPSYEFSQGVQFRFDPMTHGPLQMHLIALSFVALGDNDFTARLPAALFSIATVGIALVLFRRYLGRSGALIAGLLFLISPYMLYYGRYQRNEAFIVVWVLLTIYALLRYLERGESGVLILFTAVNALHFTDKATGFIFAGGQMIFLVGYLLVTVFRRPQVARSVKIQFLISFLLSALLLLLGMVMMQPAFSESESGALVLPGAVVAAVGLAVLVYGLVLIGQGAGAILRRERSFDLIILLGTLVLPLTGAVWMVSVGQLFGASAPINMNFSGASNLMVLFDPDQPYWAMLGGIFLYVAVPTLVAIAVGLWWKRKEWPLLALVFYGIFAFFFTSALTTLGGLFDGLVRYLGYWIVQHGEERASQPWFYYLLIQIPIYEYLPALGALGAFAIALRRRLWSAAAERPFQPLPENEEQGEEQEDGGSRPVPVISLILFWALFSLAIFSYAGEKMPQQTMLIAAPLILAAAWAVGYLLETDPAETLLRPLGWIIGIPAGIAGWFGATLTPAPRAAEIAGRTVRIPRDTVRWARAIVFAVFAFLAVLTARTAYFAAFINYDYPNEYMAYAHGAPGPKIALKEIERLSYLTTAGTDLVVAYDNFVRYPYWWYLRHYPNKIDFDVNPTADIRRAAIVVVGEQNNSKAAAILGEDYVGFVGMRMWWHNQDYFQLKWEDVRSEYLAEAFDRGVESPPPMSVPDYLGLVWENHFSPILSNPQARSAAFQVWLNRDFTEWGAYVNHGGYSYQDWSLVERLYIYFRKDVLDYLGGASEGPAGYGGAGYDPYELSLIDLIPDLSIGVTGSAPGEFAAPRGIALAPDGSLYAADSMNHRIQHFDANGELIRQWGTFASVDQGAAPGGTFNEPWGVGVGPDGSVYVADTWNHRVQKFTAEGEFLTMWGAPPSDTTAEISFYGPRDVAVDSDNRVFVSDTGNKRIMVFSSEGELLTEFGTPGAGEGQLDEPVGLALDEQGRVYVADTWNRRVQIFAPQADGSYASVEEWEVNAWFGTTAEIKPYLAVDSSHHVYITDPSTCRILEFTERGVVLAVWGSCGEDELSLNSPTGLAVDPLGGLWVSDSRHDRLVHYPMPPSGGGVLRLP